MLAQAQASCQAIQNSSTIPVTCKIQTVGDLPAVLVGFRNKSEADTYLKPVADNVGAPFCVAANGMSSPAALIVLVEQRYMRAFDCSSQAWTEWTDLIFEQAVQRCDRLRAAESVPIDCNIGDVEGMPALLLQFTDEASANRYMDVIQPQIGAPFCDSTNRVGMVAGVFVFAGSRGRALRCDVGQWSGWISLAPPHVQKRPPPSPKAAPVPTTF
jgi:hypothetical protein